MSLLSRALQDELYTWPSHRKLGTGAQLTDFAELLLTHGASPRTVMALLRAGYRHLDRLRAMPDDALLGLRHIGPAALAELHHVFTAVPPWLSAPDVDEDCYQHVLDRAPGLSQRTLGPEVC